MFKREFFEKTKQGLLINKKHTYLREFFFSNKKNIYGKLREAR